MRKKTHSDCRVQVLNYIKIDVPVKFIYFLFLPSFWRNSFQTYVPIITLIIHSYIHFFPRDKNLYAINFNLKSNLSLRVTTTIYCFEFKCWILIPKLSIVDLCHLSRIKLYKLEKMDYVRKGIIIFGFLKSYPVYPTEWRNRKLIIRRKMMSLKVVSYNRKH